MKKVVTLLLILILLVGSVSAAGFLDTLSSKPGDTKPADNKLDSGRRSAPPGGSAGKRQLGGGLFDEPIAEPTGLEAVSCIDSDDGLSFGVAGKVTGKVDRDGASEGTFYDLCKDGNTLIEAFCSPWNGLVKFNKVYCHGGCQSSGDGAFCPSPPYCIDTDPAQGVGKKGHAILIKSADALSGGQSLARALASNNLEIYVDACSDSASLVQYSCSASGVTEYVTACGGSSPMCCNGRCVSADKAAKLPGCASANGGAPAQESKGAKPSSDGELKGGASKDEKKSKPSEDESQGGFFGSLFGGGAAKKAAAGKGAVPLEKGDAKDKPIGGADKDANEQGAVDCTIGQQVQVNGVPVLCSNFNKVTYTLKLKAGYSPMLGMNVEAAGAGSASNANQAPNSQSSSGSRPASGSGTAGGSKPASSGLGDIPR